MKNVISCILLTFDNRINSYQNHIGPTFGVKNVINIIEDKDPDILPFFLRLLDQKVLFEDAIRFLKQGGFEPSIGHVLSVNSGGFKAKIQKIDFFAYEEFETISVRYYLVPEF